MHVKVCQLVESLSENHTININSFQSNSYTIAVTESTGASLNRIWFAVL